MTASRDRWLVRLTNVDAVIVPVSAGHVLVDVGVNPRHLCSDRGARERAWSRCKDV